MKRLAEKLWKNCVQRFITNYTLTQEKHIIECMNQEIIEDKKRLIDILKRAKVKHEWKFEKSINAGLNIAIEQIEAEKNVLEMIGKKEHKKKTKIQLLDINGDWTNIYNDWSEVRGKELDSAGYFENIRIFRKRGLVSIYREVEVDEK